MVRSALALLGVPYWFPEPYPTPVVVLAMRIRPVGAAVEPASLEERRRDSPAL
ncbi:hypothetical protein RBH26_11150 [Natronolimnohabitans sp. A-GB9]|uniref:hypothetical protein n=1 Tax=Natronolimnohabitans sp. A-GB9 TaxID=3069757 RepID=UPI0027B030CF|nr:hypothetical protein [Natronolimnohabitans sp. A-GB9]MDQ2051037.1 hypothetical protein [Natronolimnohabitans sp. A-GB9]